LDTRLLRSRPVAYVSMANPPRPASAISTWGAVMVDGGNRAESSAVFVLHDVQVKLRWLAFSAWGAWHFRQNAHRF
jgi:hypothetical protein